MLYRIVKPLGLAILLLNIVSFQKAFALEGAEEEAKAPVCTLECMNSLEFPYHLYSSVFDWVFKEVPRTCPKGSVCVEFPSKEYPPGQDFECNQANWSRTKRGWCAGAGERPDITTPPPFVSPDVLKPEAMCETIKGQLMDLLDKHRELYDDLVQGNISPCDALKKQIEHNGGVVNLLSMFGIYGCSWDDDMRAILVIYQLIENKIYIQLNPPLPDCDPEVQEILDPPAVG